jgi:hypothetical protein
MTRFSLVRQADASPPFLGVGRERDDVGFARVRRGPHAAGVAHKIQPKGGILGVVRFHQFQQADSDRFRVAGQGDV